MVGICAIWYTGVAFGEGRRDATVPTSKLAVKEKISEDADVDTDAAAADDNDDDSKQCHGGREELLWLGSEIAIQKDGIGDANVDSWSCRGTEMR